MQDGAQHLNSKGPDSPTYFFNSNILFDGLNLFYPNDGYE